MEYITKFERLKLIDAKEDNCKDILDLILNITKKVLLKELDAKTIDKIIKSAISLLEKKENIEPIRKEKQEPLANENLVAYPGIIPPKMPYKGR